MRHFADTFTPAPDARQQLTALIQTCDCFRHLSRARLACVYSQRVILDRGSVVPALTVAPAQIASKQIEKVFHEWALACLLRESLEGELPDFVTYLDHSLFTAMSPLEQERVLYHELRHIQPRRDSYDTPQFQKDGRPALRLTSHDIECFTDELERYGRLVPAFDLTAIAIARGANALKPRRIA